METVSVFTGFSARAAIGAFGWSSVALIRDGKNNILVDTGGPAHRVELVRRLGGLGVRPSDVNVLLLTHLHWDHAYNFDLFPKAVIMVSRPEWEYAGGTSDAPIYKPTIQAMAERELYFFPGETVTLPCGVTAIPTPGHTPGSAAFIAEGKDGLFAITGDAIKNREELLTGAVVQTSDPALSRESIERVKAFGAKYYQPGHDVCLETRDGGIYAASDGRMDVTFPHGITMDGKSLAELHMDPSLPHRSGT